MQQSIGRRPLTAPVVLGIVLVVLGIGAMIARQVDINFFESLGEGGWPYLVIVPGLVLLGLAFVPASPRGVGFATAGAIVTTVGAILLYQSRSGHWESWAYVWTLLPGAAGIALVLYGIFARERGMIVSGAWMAGISALLFVAGAWFFEGLFAGEDRIIDAGNWWPVAVIILGVVIAMRSVLFPGSSDRASESRATAADAAPPAAAPPAAAPGGPVDPARPA